MTNRIRPSKPISLQLPVKDVLVTQPFGVNFLNFYVKLGLDGH